MARDYLNNVVGRGYGPAEHGQSGHDYGASSMNGPTRADELHAEFLEWLANNYPQRHTAVRMGFFIPERDWQEWQAQWRME